MVGSTKVLGAEMYATNFDSAGQVNYLQALQVPYSGSTGTRCKVYKIVVSNLTAGTNLYLWVFDLAAGTLASVAPRMVELCPAGVCTTLDLAGGKPFYNGVYCLLSSTSPTAGNVGGTAAGANQAIIDVDYRLE